MSLIYHITSRTAADAARLSNEYRPESLEKEGFIHLSQRHQVSGVANSFYKGQTDLVILVVDETLLKPELKYEAPVHPTPLGASHFPPSGSPSQPGPLPTKPPSGKEVRCTSLPPVIASASTSTSPRFGGTEGGPTPHPEHLFPHLYGPLNFDAVVEIIDLIPTPDLPTSL
jgi:uncharacterized protein (DUF952 family)